MAAEQAETSPTTIFVCITCRRSSEDFEPPEGRSGFRLHRLLADKFGGAAYNSLELRAVECLSNCSRGCSVAFASPGKWTYVIGNLDPDANVEDILAFAKLHHAHPEGVPAWRERPESIRKGAVARVPPMARTQEEHPTP